jgi:hypothetical protein
MAQEFDEDKYGEDAAYRLQYGPSIEQWGEFGFDESLIGLKIVLDFAHGKCEGTVRSVREAKLGGESIFNVA